MERREFLSALGGRSTDGGELRTVAVVREREPEAFRRAFVAAVARGGQVALANPDWGTQERAEFERLIARRPDTVSAERGWLLIPTGGSTGGVKLARHDQATIAAAVRGYATFFDETPINAVGVLPLHHVGGLMGWLRCVLTEGVHVDADWRAWSEGRFVERPPEASTVSLVPAQLRRLLHDADGVAWLRRFRRVLIGGAAVDAGLLEQAVAAGVAVVPSYGMTETAAMIAACVEPAAERLVLFPHVEATLGAQGCLQLAGPSLFRGYWPEWRGEEAWLSSDRAELTPDGGVRILGRADAVIVTGGEKVDPAEVEAELRVLFADDRVAVVGVPDPRWGQRVVAAIAADLAPCRAEVAAELRGRLAPFKCPKAFVPVDPWPVNAAGKVSRETVLAAIAKAEAGL